MNTDSYRNNSQFQSVTLEKPLSFQWKKPGHRTPSPTLYKRKRDGVEGVPWEWWNPTAVNETSAKKPSKK